ncbi:MAG: TlyA family RNA methyltransferase [Alphaproteobacteria bacterium]
MFNSFIIQRKFKNMRLDQILTETVKFVKTKQRAVALIMSGNVFLGEKKIDKPGKIMKQNQIIRIKDNNNPWVSRGGIKLQKAISFFGVNVEDKICLDIGCSTGGFTEVLFKKKAKKIYAVDVGYGQFDWKLRNSKNIILIEKTNARFLDKNIIKDSLDLIVCDVSFISLKKVILPCKKLLKEEFQIITLIKPQFEVERKLVGKGGIVKNNSIHKKVCEDIFQWFSEIFSPDYIKIIESPISGQKGNKEFLIYVKKN